MKKLCGEEAIALVPVLNGIIIIKREKAIGTKAGFTPRFELFSADTFRMSQISRTDFLLYKFGNCFEAISDQVKGPYSCKTVILPQGRVLAVDTNGIGEVFNASGAKIRDIDMTYNGSAPSDICLCEDELYAAYKAENALLKYNPYTLAQQMRFGAKDESTFASPISLCGYKDRLYICNAKGDKITIFEKDSYEVVDYAEFKEPLLQYIRMNGCELVLLSSGVYKI
jgi:hypothetical protein